MGPDVEQYIPVYLVKLSVEEDVSPPEWEWTSSLLAGSRYRVIDQTILVDQIYKHIWQLPKIRDLAWQLIQYEIAHVFYHYKVRAPPHIERERILVPKWERRANYFAEKQTGLTKTQAKEKSLELYKLAGPKLMDVLVRAQVATPDVMQKLNSLCGKKEGGD